MFEFHSEGGARLSPPEWLAEWSAAFDATKFPEDVYEELVAKGIENFSEADFDVLGAWKDGALRRGKNVKFGNCSISFTGAWKENAVAAYTVWRNLPQSRRLLAGYLDRNEHRFFLDHLSKESFKKAGKKGLEDAKFGLSRATYVLHVFSGAKFPIYDTNTHAGVRFLTRGRYGDHHILKTKSKDAGWYLGAFCSIIRDLQDICGAQDLPSQRALDKALFCYGKRLKWNPAT